VAPPVDRPQEAGLAADREHRPLGRAQRRVDRPADARAAPGRRRIADGDVFEIVQRMWLRHQLEQLAAGEAPSDTVKLRDVSTIDASVLTDAVREILAIQRRMANRAKFVPDLQDSPLL
jgi:CBS domain-containing protein